MPPEGLTALRSPYPGGGRGREGMGENPYSLPAQKERSRNHENPRPRRKPTARNQKRLGAQRATKAAPGGLRPEPGGRGPEAPKGLPEGGPGGSRKGHRRPGAKQGRPPAREAAAKADGAAMDCGWAALAGRAKARRTALPQAGGLRAGAASAHLRWLRSSGRAAPPERPGAAKPPTPARRLQRRGNGREVRKRAAPAAAPRKAAGADQRRTPLVCCGSNADAARAG